jgi:hypothetical protein
VDAPDLRHARGQAAAVAVSASKRGRGGESEPVLCASGRR